MPPSHRVKNGCNIVDRIEKNRLLIVDDDKLNLMALAHILQQEYIIHVASNGESAIKIAEEHAPDLILLDIIMPGMDGYQTFTALQNNEKTMHIPVIFITGLSTSSDEKNGLMLGAVDYISKPFDDMIVKLRVRHQIRIINQMRLIEYLSIMDQLTEIPNRRNFDNRLHIEWGRAIREAAPISLLMIDIDHFKIYNDTYGHPQGDTALRALARVLRESLKRETDFVARLGGEEFAVLVPNTSSDGALKIGRRIRKNIESSAIPCVDGSCTQLTVSIGVNTHTPAHGSSLDEFIAKADQALYAAKNTGRNRVCPYRDEYGKKMACRCKPKCC
jgi:diguanylate cyclase (GGDEF)-like protein